jgi:hypothetical protein
MTAILATINKLSFRVAKTMPQIPHQYTVRHEATDQADYVHCTRRSAAMASSNAGMATGR